MKRIGIVTTHRANNFGAVLQAYSLVEACKELGGGAEIVDWRIPYYEDLYHHLFRKRSTWKRSLARAAGFWTFSLPMRRGYAAFRAQMPMSRPVSDWGDLCLLAKEYDSFIVGSDQVWNPQNSACGDPHGFDRATLLSFAGDKKRYAYAASIGVDSIRPADLLPEFKAEWEKFAMITMREHDGAAYVSGVIGKPVAAVLDPVFLHDAGWWRKRFSARPLPRGKYVLVYNLHNARFLNDYAARLAAARGASVVPVMVGHSLHIWRPGMASAGPQDFIKLVEGAEAIVTQSFHASAFSAVFRKELHHAIEYAPGEPNTRFASFSKFTGIEGVEVAREGRSAVVRYDCGSATGTKLEEARAFSLGKLREMVNG